YSLAPGGKRSLEALYQAAFLSYQFQDYDGAARRFREFIKKYGRSRLRKDAEWNLAWIHYLKGDYAKAYEEMNQLMKRLGKNASKERLEYWMAMSLLRQKKEFQARPLFEKLAKDKSMGYYSLAARARLRQLAPAEPRLNRGIASSDRPLNRFSLNEILEPFGGIPEDYDALQGASEPEEELRLTLGPAAEEETPSEEATTADGVAAVDEGQPEEVVRFSNPQLVAKFSQARDLALLRLEDWARWDLYEIERATSNREHLRTLMHEYATIGQYHRSSYIASVVFSQQRLAHGIEGIRYLWELAYPEVYKEHVLKAASDFAVPTELIWGIMRAESNYRQDAISPVGALGLMQVMPHTGKKVAEMLKLADFRAEKLLEPQTSIRIGSRYLARLMRRFENVIPVVAAAYNAGPHRAKLWLSSFGRLDMDEFIEHIPFLETRNYVKKVIVNVHIYSSLYHGGKDHFPYLASPVPVKWEKGVPTKETWDDT
ncbi:MAG: transglycosylase SLT domain-containing protein, partial [Bdellovibrionaceae bacterium]|nr:transglycosylase SLT domain-containing protein [Pseudobdellovibrionaceae bacterium]